MQTYFVSCRKNAENKDAKTIKTKNGRLEIRFRCSICGNKESRFVKPKKQKQFYNL